MDSQAPAGFTRALPSSFRFRITLRPDSPLPLKRRRRGVLRAVATFGFTRALPSSFRFRITLRPGSPLP